MFGVGLLLGIGLGTNSCCRHNNQYDRHRRDCNRYDGCYGYNQSNYGHDRCGCGCGRSWQNCGCRSRY